MEPYGADSSHFLGCIDFARVLQPEFGAGDRCSRDRGRLKRKGDDGWCGDCRRPQ